MRARVLVTYKTSVFDPQGDALAKTLHRIGFTQVKGARVGKTIELDLSSNSKEEAKKEVHKMCETLLANPVIEAFTYEIFD